MAYVDCRNIWKQYGANTVLENVSAQVEKGEFVTIVGASGCGKTTFLKMLLGTEVPSKGKLLLNNNPLPAEPGPERGIVFQRYSVFPHLSVLENVMLAREFEQSPCFGKLWGKAKKMAIEEAKDMLDKVGLSAALQRYPHELSGGMQQRLALAQSLIKKPNILLLDEPFGALDPGIRNDMHDLVLSLWKVYQLTVFMITHDLKEGFYLGTRLWVFDKDRIDPHKPEAYGARITYDLSVDQCDDDLLEKINERKKI